MFKKLDKDEQAFLDAGIKPRIINLMKEGREDAEFSKMLATIRVDALKSFDVKETEWKERSDADKIIKLL